MSDARYFWLVWGEGQGVPTVKHDTKAAARAEARRLARRAPGVRFVVLRATDAFEVEERPVRETVLVEDPLPF